MFGLMVVERISLLLVALRLLVLAFICLPLSLHLMVWFGEQQKSMAMLVWSVAPGVMQTVQRAEFWGAIVALLAYWPCHLGIDNRNVARSIGCLLDSDCLSKPLPLVKYGDLMIALARYMIRTRGLNTVRVTKVKGRAEDVDVQQGRVWLLDKQGNADAD